ncbi:hypothetical protein Acr_05g0007710 [Actinidia rufa]|uniref:Uncharacterized protein n=1 Tax=Actinidia rufa TaxID=165716 RepID=A0A7J0ELF2_9ERIC|nr:hypothetical protein Acr_05g0007710 [Actinidia rufa]
MLPVLTKEEAKRTTEVLGKIDPEGYFDVSKVLDYKTFKKHFARSRMEVSSSGGENTTSGDEGESRLFRGDLQCGSLSCSDSVEYPGVIRGDIKRIARKAFPNTPDFTLLRWLGGKVQDPFMNLFLRGPSSNSTSRSESLLDLGLSPEFRSNGIVLKTRHSFYFNHGLTSVLFAAMSSQISLSTLTKKAKEKKAATKDRSSLATSQPPLKGIVIQEKRPWEDVHDPAAKKGEVDDSKGKEVMPPPPPPKRTKSNKGTSNAAMHTLTLGTSSSSLGDNLGSGASMMSSAPVAQKILNRVILPVDKEKISHANSTELLKWRARWPSWVKDGKDRHKKLAIEEFKSSDDFKEVVIDSAATYFSEGFEFCKRQLLHQYPNLGIDVASMEMDVDFVEEEVAAKASEKEEDNEGEANPAP